MQGHGGDAELEGSGEMGGTTHSTSNVTTTKTLP
jgi:hypothetical protein